MYDLTFVSKYPTIIEEYAKRHNIDLTKKLKKDEMFCAKIDEKPNIYTTAKYWKKRKNELKKMIELRKQAFSILKIAQELKLSESVVSAGLKYANAKGGYVHYEKPEIKARIEAVRKEYEDGLSNLEISEKLGLALTVVGNYIQRLGLPSRKGRYRDRVTNIPYFDNGSDKTVYYHQVIQVFYLKGNDLYRVSNDKKVVINLNSKTMCLVGYNRKTIQAKKIFFCLHHKINVDDTMKIRHADLNPINNSKSNLILE